MDPRDVLTRTADGPDAVLRYADHADAVIDVHLPPGRVDVPPLVVLLHGGFWKVEWDRTHTRPLANALARDGLVVATPEFRRVGGPGNVAGGWPATVDDVAAAMRALPDLLGGLGVVTHGTTVVGHSAGGHLALWLANEPFPIDRVVGLAPVADLRSAAAAHLGGDATQALLGGEPHEVPERYNAADPVTRLQTRPPCEIVMIQGLDDDVVPPMIARGLHAAYPWTVLRELEGVEHFGLIDPLSKAWTVVLAAVRGPSVD